MLDLLFVLTILLILLGAWTSPRRGVTPGWLAPLDRRRSSQTIARVRKSGWVAVFAVGG
jgi:hypothetical protein